MTDDPPSPSHDTLHHALTNALRELGPLVAMLDADDLGHRLTASLGPHDIATPSGDSRLFDLVNETLSATIRRFHARGEMDALAHAVLVSFATTVLHTLRTDYHVIPRITDNPAFED